MKTLCRLCIALVALCIIALAIAAYSFPFSALAAPGRFETWAATSAKHWYISRAARGVPAEPPDGLPSQASGQIAYGADCSSCHGLDARTPAKIGLSMYPSVPDLGSKSVQSWSNAELFCIIKDGVAHSGMPGFGKIQDDDTIWDLVHYVRSIPAQPKP